jgi:hypothetical protein
MSTVQKVNFEPVSNVMHIQTRDFPLVDPTIANPYNADALVDGEWMSITSAYKMQRAASVAAAGNAATAHSWPYWMEKGRYDVQAQAERKGAILWLGQWEFDTRIYLETGMTQGGLVSVSSIQPGGAGTKIYCGLVNNGTIASPLTGITVGYITRLPATNGGKLRIRGGMLF